MKYIIDPTIPFEGAVLTSMNDNNHSDYGGETLEKLKAAHNNPNLEAVSPEKVTELVNQHRASLNKEPFKEIDEERYYDAWTVCHPRECYATLSSWESATNMTSILSASK